MVAKAGYKTSLSATVWRRKTEVAGKVSIICGKRLMRIASWSGEATSAELESRGGLWLSVLRSIGVLSELVDDRLKSFR